MHAVFECGRVSHHVQGIFRVFGSKTLCAVIQVWHVKLITVKGNDKWIARNNFERILYHLFFFSLCVKYDLDVLRKLVFAINGTISS